MDEKDQQQQDSGNSENSVLASLGLHSSDSEPDAKPATPPDEDSLPDSDDAGFADDDHDDQTATAAEKEKTEHPVATPDSAKKPEPDSSKPAATSSDADQLRAELAQRNTELEAERKRAHDNQAAYTKAQQQLKKLQKESGGDNWFSDDDDTGRSADDAQTTADHTADKSQPPAEITKLQQQIQQIEQEQQQLRIERWHNAEAAVKTAHPDYEDVVYKLLEPAMQKGDAQAAILEKEFKAKGASPETAYQLGLLLRNLTAPQPAATPSNNDKNKAARIAAAKAAAGNSVTPGSGGNSKPALSVLQRLTA